MLCQALVPSQWPPIYINGGNWTTYFHLSCCYLDSNSIYSYVNKPTYLVSRQVYLGSCTQVLPPPYLKNKIINKIFSYVSAPQSDDVDTYDSCRPENRSDKHEYLFYLLSWTKVYLDTGILTKPNLTYIIEFGNNRIAPLPM